MQKNKRRYYLSLGSNIHPEKNMPESLRLLRKTLGRLRVSSFYETDPVGPAGRACFWNCAVTLRSSLKVSALKRLLAALEQAMGRRRAKRLRYRARTIDLDLLPKRGYKRQAYVMIPLAEIAPRAVAPGTKKTFARLAARFKGTPSVRRLISRERRKGLR
ncbi:MAG: 2-amino-4-hydroxy-6-hydroxymethyldihydropteridine diphosphokinase [Candidatus Omnitrophota bacterium]